MPGRTERCQVCVSSVEGHIGYEPSRLSLRAELEDNACVRSHVLAYEQRHADVTRRAEACDRRRRDRAVPPPDKGD